MTANNQDWSHFTATNLSTALGAVGACTVSVVACPFGPCLKVNYGRQILRGLAWQTEWHTVDYSWLEALGPDSYGVTK